MSGIFFYLYMDYPVDNDLGIGFFRRFGMLILVLTALQLSNCSPQRPYTFQAKELCSDENGLIRYLELDTMQRYGTNRPFQVKRILTQDSLLISFKVIQDCCLTPKPEVHFSDFEVSVGFQFDSASCDCVCDYLFQYGFSLASLGTRGVVIHNQ
jgi:hypothetical protein